MLQITLPDGSKRDYPGPVSVAEVASTRIHNHARQRGKKSELVADPGLVTKQLVKEGVDVPPGVVAGRCGSNEEASITA